jgi:hypothetical protein
LLNLKNYEKNKKRPRGRRSEDNYQYDKSQLLLKASGSRNGSFDYSNNERKI